MNISNLPISQSENKRAGDQQRSFELFTYDQILQQDLFQQFWIYAIPPKSGEDLYQSSQHFMRRACSRDGYGGRGLAGAKGLREWTRAIFNYVPYIVSQNKSMIMNGARPEGIKVSLPGGGVDDALTAEAQEMMSWQWSRVLSKMLLNGLVTGNAYIWPKSTGKPGPKAVKFDVLFSNNVFPDPSLIDLDEFNFFEIKYRVEGTQNEPYEFYQKITNESVMTRWKGDKEELTIPWGINPITFIRNIEIPGEVYGANCFYQCLSDIDQLNEMAGDLIEALSLYGTPIAVVEDGVAPEDGLKLGVHSIIELSQGKFKLLEFTKLDAQMQNIINIAAQVRKKIPEFDLADIEAGGGQLSGHAIRLRLSTLISKIMGQQTQYEEGLEKAIQYGLNILKRNQNYIEYKVSVDLGQILPEDIKENLAIETQKLAIGLTVKRQAMQALGMSPEEIEAVEAEQSENDEIISGMREQLTGQRPQRFRDDQGRIFEQDGEELREVRTDGE